jgi:hypothetical protein
MTCTFHCAACGSHFHSLEGFDRHRSGDHATRRFCLDPDDVDRLVVATTDGVCRLVRGVPELSPVTIYRSRRHADDQDAVLRLRSADRLAEDAADDLDAAGASTRPARALAGVGS